MIEKTDDEELDQGSIAFMGAARLAYFTPVREFPPLGDRKASILLAINGLMIAVLFTFAPRAGKILTADGALAWVASGLFAIWFVLIVVGGVMAFIALTMPIPAMPDSLAFFRHIRARRFEDYRAEVRSRSHGDAVRDMLNYNYSLAILSASKFRWINRATLLACAAFGVWMVLMMIFAVGGR